MGKAKCPFCNSNNTFNIAYGYFGSKKTKNNFIDQKEIGLNESYRKGFEKFDFDGEKLVSHLPNRYCKDCGKTFQSRKVMYTIDIITINFIVWTNNNYYRLILDFSDKDNPKYSLKINWLSITINECLKIKDRNKILLSFKKYKPNLWNGHYGKYYDYNNYYWILKCTYYNGVDYVKSGNDKVPDNWEYFIKPFKELFDNIIFDLKS